MTIAVDMGRKATKTNKQNQISLKLNKNVLGLPPLPSVCILL